MKNYDFFKKVSIKKSNIKKKVFDEPKNEMNLPV